MRDRKSTRLNSSHDQISYAVFCLKKKTRTFPRTSSERARNFLLSTASFAGFSRLPGGPAYFVFNDPATTEIYTLSLHDALPISPRACPRCVTGACEAQAPVRGRRSGLAGRSEEHTSELQSRSEIVCRLLLEKKKKNKKPKQLKKKKKKKKNKKT